MTADAHEIPLPNKALAAVIADLGDLMPAGNLRATHRIQDYAVSIVIRRAVPLSYDATEAILRRLDCGALRIAGIDPRTRIGSLQGHTRRHHADVTVTITYRD